MKYSIVPNIVFIAFSVVYMILNISLDFPVFDVRLPFSSFSGHLQYQPFPEISAPTLAVYVIVFAIATYYGMSFVKSLGLSLLNGAIFEASWFYSVMFVHYLYEWTFLFWAPAMIIGIIILRKEKLLLNKKSLLLGIAVIIMWGWWILSPFPHLNNSVYGGVNPNLLDMQRGDVNTWIFAAYPTLYVSTIFVIHLFWNTLHLKKSVMK